MILRFRFTFTVLLSIVVLRSNGYSYLKPIIYGEGECFDDDWISHPIGSVWYDNSNCEKLECVFHKNVLYAKGYGCPTIGVPPDCRLVPGKGPRYPYCCPQVQCKDGIIW